MEAIGDIYLLLCVCVFIYIHTHTEKEIYYEKLTHMSMEADRYYDLHLKLKNRKTGD